MQTIVNTLCALDGVRYSGLYQDGVLVDSNFPSAQQEAMSKSSSIITQMFFALESVEKSHNELYFSVDSGYLAAFRLSSGYIALLLTDKKINLPMLSMAIKSASETLRHQQEVEQAEHDRLRYLAGLENQTQDEATIPVDESLLPMFEQYTQLLTRYLGPAASVVVDDAVGTWKQTYIQSPSNLPYLLAILEEELDSEKDRQSFAAKAAGVTLPAM